MKPLHPSNTCPSCGNPTPYANTAGEALECDRCLDAADKRRRRRRWLHLAYAEPETGIEFRPDSWEGKTA